MTADDLAKNYLNRSVSRIKMLKFLLEEEAKRAVLDTEFIYNLVKKEIVGRDV